MLSVSQCIGQRVKTLTTKGLEVLMPNVTERNSLTQSERYLQVAVKACDGARVILDSHFGNLRNLDEKFQAGLVSDADRESEKFIVEEIRKVFPDHAILGEEGGLTGAESAALPKSGALWMIDPLDGTTNFVHQFPFFCISIGLLIDGELVMGVVDAPKLGMRFYATKGGGAFLNGERIQASRRAEFREGLFATGFSSYDDELDQQLALVSCAIREARGIRRAGAAALDLCFVAQGVYDVFWEKNLSPWDMAAGVLIASEAGAVATDFDGKPFDPHGRSVICGSKIQHAHIMKRMQDIRRDKSC
jgi:myo-inositol-1(or 4)-monophosphatase